MNAEAILTISAAVVPLVQLLKWSGLQPRFAPLGVLSVSLLGVCFWAWAMQDFTRASSFQYFAGWVTVAMMSAGVFGFVREGAAMVASMRKDP